MDDGVDSVAKIGRLFQACDIDGSGYIDEEEFSHLCPDLSGDEVKAIFKALDANGDGRISRAEFTEGFKNLGTYERIRRASRVSRGSIGGDENVGEANVNAEKDRLDFIDSLDEGLSALSCQEQVCELYQQLHHSDLSHTLGQFEDVIVAILRDVRQQKREKERLEKLYKVEKDKHDEHLRQLEEEMEAQMQRVEVRVRKEEKEKAELEKKELESRLDTEIIELQGNLKRLQKLEHEVGRESTSSTMETRARMSEMAQENRQLRSQLTEAQTNLAVLRCELATLKQDYQDSRTELTREKDTIAEYLQEQENLTRQLHVLQSFMSVARTGISAQVFHDPDLCLSNPYSNDANKRLHDTNDDLRSALETRGSGQKRTHSGTTAPRVVAMRNHPSLGNLAVPCTSPSTSTPQKGSGFSGAASQHSTAADDSLVACDPAFARSMSVATDNCDVDSLPDDYDSGHFTLRDTPELDSEYEPNSLEEELQHLAPRKRNRHGRQAYRENTLRAEQEGDMEMEGEADLDVSEDEVDRPAPPASRTSSRASRDSQRRSNTVRRKLPILPQPVITGEPERMYKVVLAGDAAVGKSSFIMRLCKGKFVSNLSSTLGVDFQTKTLQVDGRIIALQLWDTAGQERFRSIAKSYFRRADGVLLLYDCSWERTFLNIRDWIEAIEDGATKKIPIMLCGNKSDLRDQAREEKRRVVEYEDGQRLAKEIGGLFIETSAKDGSNVLESVTELARMLRTNEDIEVKAVGMQLQELQGEKKSCCK